MGKKKLLITGASGNIGYEIIRGLYQIKTEHEIIAADFDMDKAKSVLSELDHFL